LGLPSVDAPVVRTNQPVSPKSKNFGTLATPSKTSCKKASANPTQLRNVSRRDGHGVQDLIDHTTISKYELDKNEPPLTILLAYARLAGIPVEQIIDDELELTI
jgi:hypothetical protein